MTRSTICLRPPDWTSAVKRRRKERSRFWRKLRRHCPVASRAFSENATPILIPLQRPPAERPHNSQMRMAAVVLAASGSTRFAKPKQVIIFRGETFVRRIVAAGAEPTSSARYSPAQFMGTRRAVISGNPDPKHISTSCDERHHMNLRMSNLTLHSPDKSVQQKKLENLEHSVALYGMHDNFCGIHRTLHMTPAVELGVTDHVW